MRNSTFETYQSFFNPEEAQPMVQLLKEHEVPYRLEHHPIFVEEQIGLENKTEASWALRIPTDYFAQVNTLLEQMAAQIKEVPQGHYLHQFDHQELRDVIENAHEWTKQDVHFAKLLLKEQVGYGAVANAERAADQKQQVLREGKEGSLGWIYAYWVISILGTLLLNPFFLMVGLGMGWFYWRDQTVAANGSKFYTFAIRTRNLGRMSFYLGLGLFLTSIVVWVLVGKSSLGLLFSLLAS